MFVCWNACILIENTLNENMVDPTSVDQNLFQSEYL